MLLRFQHVSRIGIIGSFALLACTGSSSDKGAGGGGSSGNSVAAAGTSPGASGGATAGASSGGASTSTAGAPNGAAPSGGAPSGGAPNGGAPSGGSATGGAGNSTGGASSGGASGSGGAGGKSRTTFFVTSDKSATGKLGGLDGADLRCQTLANAAGLGDHTFHAYLSTATTNAKTRIGSGPWVNAKGVMLAPDVATLHSGTVKGDHTLFIDEKGNAINGQWNSSPTQAPTSPTDQVNEHDILTGSKADGTVQTGVTCQDWTSDSANDKAQVGHSDGMGPGMATTGTYTSWNSAHASGSCAATWMAGGAGRLYCFAIN